MTTAAGPGRSYADTGYGVRIDLAWLPLPEAGYDAGRLLLRRTVAPSRAATGRTVLAGARSCTDFWISDVVDADVLVDAPPVTRASVWPALLRGDEVGTVESPVPMYPMRRGDGYPDPAGARPLLDVGITVRVEDGAARLAAARVGLTATDPLTHHVRGAIDRPLSALRRTAVPTAAPPPADEEHWAADLAARIRLVGTRGVQIGDHNVQVNRFVAEAPDLRLDFDALLDLRPVRDALVRLRGEPGSVDRRRALVHALAQHGWLFRAEPVTLRVGPSEPFRGFLAGLLLFDVRGLQVGSHGRQVNRFVSVVTGTPGAAELLRGNDRLAHFLSECLCPSPGSRLNAADLGSEALRAFHALAPDWRDGRTHGRSERPHARGTRIFRFVDGLAVGEHNRQTVEHTVVARALSVLVPQETPPPAKQKRQVTPQVEYRPQQQERLRH